VSTAAAADDRRVPWVAILLVVVAFGAVFHPILIARARLFMEQPRFSHGLLVPVVAALWVMDRQSSLARVPRSTSRAGLGVLAAAVVLNVYGRTLDAKVGTLGTQIQHPAAILAVAGVVWAVLGRRFVRAVLFPIAYLVFTVPVPQRLDIAITLPLQRLSAEVATACFDAMGWAVAQEGNVVQLPGVTLLVEEQCSGVHSLYALIALGVAWTAFVPRPRWTAVTLVAATIPIAVFANVVRVIGTGVLAYRLDPGYAEGVSHDVASLVVFAIGLATFLLLDWALRPDSRPPPAVAQEDGTSA